MPTIGRHHRGPRRDYQHACDVCGVNWLRSQLRRNANGVLVCPDDIGGRVETQLDRLRHPPFGIPIVGTTASSYNLDPSPAGTGTAPEPEETPSVTVSGSISNEANSGESAQTVGSIVGGDYSIAANHTALYVVLYRFGDLVGISGGPTWTQVIDWNPGGTGIAIFTATPSAAQISFTVTTTFGPDASLYASHVSVGLFTCSAAATIVQSGSVDSASATSATVTLVPFAHATNVAFGIVQQIGTSDGGTILPGAGFSTLADGSLGGGAIGRRYNIEASAAEDRTVDWTWASAKTRIAVALELQAT